MLMRIMPALVPVLGLTALPLILFFMDRASNRSLIGRYPFYLRPLAALALRAADLLGKRDRNPARTGHYERLLYPGIRVKGLVLRRRIKKVMLFYACLYLAAWLALAYLAFHVPRVLTEDGLPREEAPYTAVLEAEAEGHVKTFEVPVHPRWYDAAGREQLFARVRDYIDETLPGDNPSLGQVSGPLCFSAAFPEEDVTIEWQPDDYRLIHGDGSLGDGEGAKLPVKTSVTAVIRYGKWSKTCEYPVTITAFKTTEEALLEKEIWDALAAADADSGEAAHLPLPDQAGSAALSWRYSQTPVLPVLLGMALAAGIALVLIQDERLKGQVKSREAELIREYPAFAHQMVLLISAGMTVRKSWEALVADQERKGGEAKKQSCLCREMTYTLRRMNAGLPEIKAYQDFGSRMPGEDYRRFCQLLIQLIRSGSRGMQEMMLQEAADAERKRRENAMRLGETAQTKLLLPMMMLLLVVLAVVMMPAFLTM